MVKIVDTNPFVQEVFTEILEMINKGKTFNEIESSIKNMYGFDNQVAREMINHYNDYMGNN